MTLVDDINLIRMKLGDYLKPAIDRDAGDGIVKQFVLTHKHIQDYEVEVDGTLKTETTDYTIDANNGIVTFVIAPASSKEVKVSYNYAGFNDTDLTTLLNTYVTVNSATQEAIKMLMADAARRFDYVHGQTQMNHSQVFEHLEKLLEVYRTSNTPTIMNRKNKYYDNETETRSDITRDEVED